MARGFNYAPGATAEFAAAAEPALDRAQVLEFGASKNAFVRAIIAAREDCPLGLMASMAHDHVIHVRCAVARNPRAQRSVLAYLSSDRSVDVLRALIENPRLPAEILDELALHRKSAIRAAAAARLDLGPGGFPDVAAEDGHTPEIAEHVVLVAATAPTTAPTTVPTAPPTAPLNAAPHLREPAPQWLPYAQSRP